MMQRIRSWAQHLWLDASDTERRIPPAMRERLTAQIAASEELHTGQIRLCIEAALPVSYLWRWRGATSLAELTRQRALGLFGRLMVWDTQRNNGVLIYVLLAEHAIEIVADRGVAEHASQAHWLDLTARMGVLFQAHRVEEGLHLALQETTALLAAHFAPDATQGASTRGNELPDAPVLL